MRQSGFATSHATLTAALVFALSLGQARPAVSATPETTSNRTPAPAPAPQPAVRPPIRTQPVVTQPVVTPRGAAPTAATTADAERLRRINGVKSWGYQLTAATVDLLAASPYDLLVIDATMGLASGQPITRDEVVRLQKKPDGGRRLVIAYLSIGEADIHRRDLFSKEYLEEDPPDWLLKESADWKGNRLVKFCAEGWQTTLLGDRQGRSLYDSLQPSPALRLVELGLDGAVLDRLDAYQDVAKDCPDGARSMIDFVARIAARLREANPAFLIVQQNAEDLLAEPRLLQIIDAVAKEALFYGWGAGGATQATAVNSAAAIKASSDRLALARAAGRPVFTVDFPADKAGSESALKRSRALGYVPYIAPKELHQLWLPGKNF